MDEFGAFPIWAILSPIIAMMAGAMTMTGLWGDLGKTEEERAAEDRLDRARRQFTLCEMNVQNCSSFVVACDRAIANYRNLTADAPELVHVRAERAIFEQADLFWREESRKGTLEVDEADRLVREIREKLVAERAAKVEAEQKARSDRLDAAAAQGEEDGFVSREATKKFGADRAQWPGEETEEWRKFKEDAQARWWNGGERERFYCANPAAPTASSPLPLADFSIR